jgi:hypothetical protein
MEPDDEMEGLEGFEGVDRDGSPAIASVSARSSFKEDTDEPQTPQKRLGGVMSAAQEGHFMGSPELLSMYQLCGVRTLVSRVHIHVNAFSLKPQNASP